MVMSSGALNLLAGFNPAQESAMGETFGSFIRNAFGANPLSQRYAQSAFTPSVLQYLGGPAATGTLGLAGANVANPFMDFLEGYNPYSGQQFATLANQVRSALGGSADLSNPVQQLLRERFGTADTADVRQQALATQPIIQNIAPALRGEVSSVLNNIYQDYVARGTSGQPSFLDYAAIGPGAGGASLWSQFGVQPSGSGTSGYINQS
jgi:hypothetical protein